MATVHSNMISASTICTRTGCFCAVAILGNPCELAYSVTYLYSTAAWWT